MAFLTSFRIERFFVLNGVKLVQHSVMTPGKRKLANSVLLAIRYRHKVAAAIHLPTEFVNLGFFQHHHQIPRLSVDILRCHWLAGFSWPATPYCDHLAAIRIYFGA